MTGGHRIYGSLVRLYPRAFRDEFGADLVQHHADLAADRGAGAAWRRTCLDLAVTLPRYHLETIMNERHSNAALSGVVILLAAGGIASMAAGGWLGMILIGAGVLLAVVQWTAVARSLRPPDSGRRRTRLLIAMALGAVFVGCYATYLMTIGDTWTARDTVLALVGTSAMFGALGFLAAGLLTPVDRGPGTAAGVS